MNAVTCCAARKPSGDKLILPGRNPDKEFVTLGRGMGGVDELATSLDETKVSFGLVPCTVGSGALARTKYVFLIFGGKKCPMVKRMRWMEKKGAAVEVCGGAGMIDWEREDATEVNLDLMLEKVLAAVVADDGGAGMSVQALREQALEQIKRAQAATPRKKRGKGGWLGDMTRTLSGRLSGGRWSTSGGGPRTALALRPDLEVSQALSMVSSEKGALNWLLVSPELQLLEAGGGSLPEMREHLPPGAVAFALVRMGFGSGRFRRNHFLFVHWASESCPMVKRGTANAKKGRVKAAIEAADALERPAATLEELDLKEIIAWMSKYIIVDGDMGSPNDRAKKGLLGGGGGGGGGGLTIEAFEEALKEDNKALAAEFGVSAEPEEDADGEAAEDETTVPVAEAVASVRSPEEPFNWVLIGPR